MAIWSLTTLEHDILFSSFWRHNGVVVGFYTCWAIPNCRVWTFRWEWHWADIDPPSVLFCQRGNVPDKMIPCSKYMMTPLYHITHLLHYITRLSCTCYMGSSCLIYFLIDKKKQAAEHLPSFCEGKWFWNVESLQHDCQIQKIWDIYVYIYIYSSMITVLASVPATACKCPCNVEILTWCLAAPRLYEMWWEDRREPSGPMRKDVVIDLRSAQVYCVAIFLVSQEVSLNFHRCCG